MPKFLLICLCVFLSGALSAQEIKPKGRFLDDSIRIGEEVRYSLSIRYRSDFELLFPDSTYDYSPFEYVSRRSYPTGTDSLYSLDSAVYTLTSFEVDLVQSLQLPVFVLNNGDSLAVLSKPDSVLFAEMIPEIPDSVALKSDTRYQQVTYGFNWLNFYQWFIPLVILLSMLVASFWHPISTRLRRSRVRRRHEQFLAKMQKQVAELEQEQSVSLSEESLLVWKTYLERLEQLPYTKLTTKELSAQLNQAELSEALRLIDRRIYGGLEDAALPAQFRQLTDFAVKRYQETIQKAPYA